MKRIRRVVVATDFSSAASAALARAVHVAREQAAVLELLHAEAAPSSPLLRKLGLKPALSAELRASSQRQLDALAEQVRAQGVDCRAKRLQGAAPAAIAAALQARSGALLVLGARGHRTVRDTVIGTTAERLLEWAPGYTLVVKGPVRAPYQRVLMCVDASPLSLRVIEAAASVCPDAVLEMLHVYEAPFEMKLRHVGAEHEAIARHRQDSRREAEQQMQSLLRTHHPLHMERIQLVLRQGYAPRMILQTAGRLQSDLIVVGKNRSPLAEAFLGSVSKHILRAASCDVMVVGG